MVIADMDCGYLVVFWIYEEIYYLMLRREIKFMVFVDSRLFNYFMTQEIESYPMGPYIQVIFTKTVL